MRLNSVKNAPRSQVLALRARKAKLSSDLKGVSDPRQVTFDAMDTNQDGVLSRQEFKGGYPVHVAGQQAETTSAQTPPKEQPDSWDDREHSPPMEAIIDHCHEMPL